MIIGRPKQFSGQPAAGDIREIALQRFPLGGFLDIELVFGRGERLLFQKDALQRHRAVVAKLKKERSGIRGSDAHAVTFRFCEKHFRKTENRARPAASLDLFCNACDANRFRQKFDVHRRRFHLGRLCGALCKGWTLPLPVTTRRAGVFFVRAALFAVIPPAVSGLPGFLIVPRRPGAASLKSAAPPVVAPVAVPDLVISVQDF